MPILREANLPPGSLVGITMQSKQLDYPIRMSLMPVEEISQEKTAATFERVMQSHNEFVLDDDVTVNVVTLEDRRGCGRVRRKISGKLRTCSYCLQTFQTRGVWPDVSCLPCSIRRTV